MKKITTFNVHSQPLNLYLFKFHWVGDCLVKLQYGYSI